MNKATMWEHVNYNTMKTYTAQWETYACTWEQFPLQTDLSINMNTQITICVYSKKDWNLKSP